MAGKVGGSKGAVDGRRKSSRANGPRQSRARGDQGVEAEDGAAGRRSDSGARPETATADRVQVIVDLMASLKWHPREAKRLAARWGISVSRVKDLSAEASRVVRGAVGDPEEIRSQLYAALMRIAAKAEGQKRPDHSAAVRALGEAADVIGLKRQSLELTGKNGAPVMGGVVIMPPERPLDDGSAAGTVESAPGAAK